MDAPSIDLSPLQKAADALSEALECWQQQPDGSRLKPHLRSGVIQSFEFTYELSVRMLRRVLIEREASAVRVADLSFNDLLRLAADAQLLPDPNAWRRWRDLRNRTSHSYDEQQAQAIAEDAALFLTDAQQLWTALQVSLRHV